MKKTAEELQQIVGEYADRISSIPEPGFSDKPLPGKWSKKEVLGHLIDSAHNNLRRFVTGQYEKTPPHIVYDQDFWVDANAYNNVNKEDLILLWRLINDRIATVLISMPAANHMKACNTGKSGDALHSLLFLADDYVKHMKHHLNQIIPGSFDIEYK